MKRIYIDILVQQSDYIEFFEEPEVMFSGPLGTWIKIPVTEANTVVLNNSPDSTVVENKSAEVLEEIYTPVIQRLEEELRRYRRFVRKKKEQ